MLRSVLCRCAAPLAPARKSVVVGRVLAQAPAAFPVIQAGRPSQHHFRGLFRLHTGTHCSPRAMGPGPTVCRPTSSGPVFQEPRPVGSPSGHLGSCWGVPITPRSGFAPASHTAPFHGPLKNAGWFTSRSSQVAIMMTLSKRPDIHDPPKQNPVDGIRRPDRRPGQILASFTNHGSPQEGQRKQRDAHPDREG